MFYLSQPGESCFYIAAKESKLVLDIEGGVVAPMTRVSVLYIMFHHHSLCTLFAKRSSF